MKRLPLVCRRWHTLMADASMWPALDVAPWEHCTRREQFANWNGWLRRRSPGMREVTLKARSCATCSYSHSCQRGAGLQAIVLPSTCSRVRTMQPWLSFIPAKDHPNLNRAMQTWGTHSRQRHLHTALACLAPGTAAPQLHSLRLVTEDVSEAIPFDVYALVRPAAGSRLHACLLLARALRWLGDGLQVAQALLDTIVQADVSRLQSLTRFEASYISTPPDLPALDELLACLPGCRPFGCTSALLQLPHSCRARTRAATASGWPPKKRSGSRTVC